MLAVPWYFTGIFNRADLFAAGYFLSTGISLFWGIYAGALIDRYDRRKIFLATNAVGFIALASITAFGFYSGSLPWLAVMAVFSTTMFIYNIHFPNLYAFSQEITPPKDYSRITSLLEIQGQLTFTIAGGLAAALLQGFDGQIAFYGFELQLPSLTPWKIQEIFAVNTITYLITFLLVWRIRSMPVVEKRTDTSHLWQRLQSGFSFLNKHPLIFHFGNLSLLLFLTILVFGTYISTVFVKNYLQGSGATFALGDMAFSFGALIAGFITTKIFGERNHVRGIILLTALAALMYTAMIGGKSVMVFYAANFVIGACNAAVRIQRVTYLFHHIPNHVIGRANSVFFVINVFLRMCLIALFNLPFFVEGTQIVYSVAVLAFICLAGALLLLINYRKLMQQPEMKP